MPSESMIGLAMSKGKTRKEAEDLWRQAEEIANAAKDVDNVFAYATGIFKRSIGESRTFSEFYYGAQKESTSVQKVTDIAKRGTKTTQVVTDKDRGSRVEVTDSHTGAKSIEATVPPGPDSEKKAKKIAQAVGR